MNLNLKRMSQYDILYSFVKFSFQVDKVKEQSSILTQRPFYIPSSDASLAM